MLFKEAEFLVNISLLVLSVAEIWGGENVSSLSARQKRIFFLFPPFYRVAGVAPRPCISNEGNEGVCYTSSSRCRTLGLTPSGGDCGTGICCINIKTCEQNSSSLVTYFWSPTTLPPKCSLRIHKFNSSIDQLRLDFVQFSLRQPIAGTCSNYLLLSPTDTALPKICGENTGSHVYVDFDPLCDDHALQLTFANLPSPDRWNIKITQITRNSLKRAPKGCLMYYTETSGTVNSFNYGTAAVATNRQLAPLHYGVCISPETGYCQIRWSPGALNIEPQGTACTVNYVGIPCSSTETDRYCQIPNMMMTFPITSSCKPFVLYVEANTAANPADMAPGLSGFSLNFQQVAC